MNKINIAFLKEKTDTECRELAGHYYRRARRAEKERDQLREQVEALRKDAEGLGQLLVECRVHLKPYHDSFMRAEAWEEGRYKPADALYRKIDAAMEGDTSEGS